MVVLYQLTAYLYQVLSPVQRFQSMRRLKASPVRDLSVAGWLMLLGWALIGLLIILFFIVRRIRLERDRLSTESRFRELCDTCRLTIQEREILSAISRRVHLKKKDDIFKDCLAFDAGFTRLIQESFSAGHNLRQRKQLNIIVQCIKAKLGFQKSSPTSDGAVQAPRKMSSRQIPEGRDVQVEVISESSVFCFDAKVIRNDSCELVLQPDTPVEVAPGLMAQVQYKVGAMTWVFELTVIACGSGGLELNHNDHAKYINRRRFARVAVQKKSKIAVFDMNQNVCGDIHSPTFVDAVVTEISGPGLQIQTDLELKMFDRILVVFEPEPGKVVQDVAEVRGFRRTNSASLVAVEMIGLNESVVNDLIRITNRIAGTAGKLLSCPENEEQPGYSSEEHMAGITRQKEQPV
jgi:hypothetical protein